MTKDAVQNFSLLAGHHTLKMVPQLLKYSALVGLLIHISNAWNGQSTNLLQSREDDFATHNGENKFGLNEYTTVLNQENVADQLTHDITSNGPGHPVHFVRVCNTYCNSRIFCYN